MSLSLMSSLSKYGIFYLGTGGGGGGLLPVTLSLGSWNVTVPTIGLSSELLFEPPPTLYPSNCVVSLNFDGNLIDNGIGSGTLSSKMPYTLTSSTPSYTDTSAISIGTYRLTLAGSSLNITSGTSYLDLSSSSISYANGFILSIWFYPTTLSTAGGGFNVIYSNNAGGNVTGTRIIILASSATTPVWSIVVGQKSGGAENYFSLGNNGVLIGQNQWNHIALSVDSTGNWLLLVNNSQQIGTSQTTNMSSLLPYISIAHENSSSNSRWTGYIDNVRIYNRAATSISELQSLYNSSLFDTGSPAVTWSTNTVSYSNSIYLFDSYSASITPSSRIYTSNFLGANSVGHTFSIWAYPTTLNVTTNAVSNWIFSNNGPANTRFAFYSEVNNTTATTVNKLRWTVIFGTRTFNGNTVENAMTFGGGMVNLNQWNHFAFSINSSGNWIILLNGTQYINPAPTNNLSSVPLSTFCIGCQNSTTGSGYWTGNIDNFKYYNNGLDINGLYNLWCQGYTPPPSYTIFQNDIVMVRKGCMAITLNQSCTIESLIVGGGGGGGSTASGNGVGSGGGGGGIIYNTYSLMPGTYNIIVGNGGFGQNNYVPTYALPTTFLHATNGGFTMFNNVITTGGGAGAGQTTAGTQGVRPGNGSSGGGGIGSGTTLYNSGIGGTGISGQGYSGGLYVASNMGGGGGGANQSGKNGSSNIGGAGGDGSANSITGTTVYYGGGGGGSGSTNGGAGGLGGGGRSDLSGSGYGIPNRGGGGAGAYNGLNYAGGDGGSGVLFLKPSTGFSFNLTPTTFSLVTSGLINHYSFMNTNSYSGSGTTVTNLVTSTGDMSIIGTTTWQTTTKTLLLNNTSTDGNSNAAGLNTVSSTINFNSISIWYKQKPIPITTVNNFRFPLFSSAAGSSFLVDGGATPRVYTSGSNWTTMYVDGGPMKTPSWTNIEFTNETWHNITFVSSTQMTGNIAVGFRSSDSKLGVRMEIAAILVYNRAITEAENDNNYYYYKNQYSFLNN